MLANFTFKDCKSFREARLPLGPLTVLIGANAAGKSNAIEALRLLSWLAQGQKLSSIQYAVNSADRVVRDGNKPRVTVSDQMAVFVQFESAVRFEAGHKKAQETVPEVARRYQNLLSNILFLDPVPARMREYSFTNDKRLLGDGTNLSSVLHRLWGADTEAASEPFATQRAAILAFIQSLPEQDIAGLSFLYGPRGEVMVQLEETFGGKPTAYDASVLLNILDVPDRIQRRAAAARFVKEVQSALSDEARWKPINFPSNQEMLSCLDAFPDSTVQGIGMGDQAGRNLNRMKPV